MTSTITVNPAASTATTLEYAEIAPAASNATVGLRRVAPTFISADEAYYWSSPWQRDVQESMAALAAGEYMEFDSDDPTDIVKWMLGADDDS